MQNLLICTRIEGDTVHHGRTELDLGDPTTQAWAMGPVAHLTDVGPRSDHYGTTRSGVTPRLVRIDSKFQSSSAREAITICMLTYALFRRIIYMGSCYGSCTKHA